MGFGAAIKSSMRQYATFSGRARRSEFWWFFLFIFLVQVPFQILFWILYVVALFPAIEAAGPAGDVDPADISWGLFAIGIAAISIVTLFFLLPYLAVMVRRLHDMGQSGWWVALAFIGFGIVPLIMCFIDTQVGDNQWGPDPKAAERPAGYGQQYPGPLAQPGGAYPPGTQPLAQPPSQDPYAQPPGR